ncbi:MAG: transporter [Planctomycetota bacterium]
MILALTLACCAAPQGAGDLSTAESLLEKAVWTPTLRPDARGFLGTAHGPIVEIDHVRLSIDWQRIEYGGLMDGSIPISSADLFARGFQRAPISGVREELHLRAEYGLSEAFTLRLDAPIVNKIVAFEDASAQRTRLRTTGLGDVAIGASVELSRGEESRSEVALDLDMPTGSVTDREPPDPNTNLAPRLPYDLQPGHGTWRLRPSFHLARWGADWSAGAGFEYQTSLDESDQGWKPGNALLAQAWYTRRFDESRSVVFAVDYEGQDEVSGQDTALDTSLDPMQLPQNTGGQRFGASIGLHMEVERRNFLAIEVGVPVWQEVEGVQLEEDYRLRLGWWMSL